MPAPSPVATSAPGGAPVGQVLQGGERLADEPVAALAREVGHQRDPAGVVLEGGVVEGRAGYAGARPEDAGCSAVVTRGLSVIGHAEAALLTLGTTLALLQPP